MRKIVKAETGKSGYITNDRSSYERHYHSDSNDEGGTTLLMEEDESGTTLLTQQEDDEGDTTLLQQEGKISNFRENQHRGERDCQKKYF